jgi:DNA-binding beta-propeller fold protein YncE/mono/diheme cytochrome c family protein
MGGLLRRSSGGLSTPRFARSVRIYLAVAAALAGVVPNRAAAFVTFETGQVRPLALTPDGHTLLALNTPDARLEIFHVADGDITAVGAVEVGLEPVAVAARTNTEVWVTNHLSDSVSIVDIGASPPHVVRTLLVGDEPSDVVFAGPTDADGHFTRAFIATARRGQNLPESIPPNLTTPGTPRALVYVFDAANLGGGLGGTPETIVQLFGDAPRALAASRDGHTVYAAIFQSGNETTTVTEGAVCDGGATAPPCALDGVQLAGGLPNGQVPGGLPAPNVNIEDTVGPETGLIVKHDDVSGVWKDGLGRNWTNAVRFSLPDLDVFRIDALANPPQQTASFAHVGTVLYNMLVDPADGTLYVSNTEARNEVRFEGPGTSATTVRGDLHEARITVIAGGTVSPRHLNKHITALPHGYRTTPFPGAIKAASLATPLDMALARDGTLYVAAFGSSAVGVFNSAEVRADTFVPDAAHHIRVSGGGPSGLALDEANHRLYVLTRFDNAVKVIDTVAAQELFQHPLFNPEPPDVVAGRPFLYDAQLTSSNGEASCASCHVFGNFDSLAWDLGNPDAVETPNFNLTGPTAIDPSPPFHPLKGPMTTQTLRGLVDQGPMHWRGDRTGDTDGFGNSSDTTLAFEAFNVAFDSLLGRDEGPLSDDQMAAFTAFALQIMPPPNPVRSLDNQLATSQANGQTLFLDRTARTDRIVNCGGCHTLDEPTGHFGTFGETTFDDEPQEFKVPQLKNAYEKVGMFGTPKTALTDVLPANAQFQGDQIRGFGFTHDGSTATMFDFFRSRFFQLTDDQRRDLEAFVFAFETTFAPIVGQQVTLTSDNAAVAGPRIDLLIARAETSFVLVDHPHAYECDLIAKGVAGGLERGYVFDPASATFRSDRAAEPRLTDAQLRSLATADGQPVTYTCVPPGEGVRLGIDRDGDGIYDQDERDAATETPTARPTPTVSPTPSATSAATPSLLPGDADCSGMLDVGDIAAMCSAAFDVPTAPPCGADCNDDGVVTAADLTCVAKALGASRQ